MRALAKLLKLYASREANLARFSAAIDADVARGWVLAADGAPRKAEEAAKPPF